MDDRITSIQLESLDRPELGSINFALYGEGVYMLERMDGYSSLAAIDTASVPLELQNGSSVSNPNTIAGKQINMTVHIVETSEIEVIKAINLINGMLRSQMRLTVNEDGDEFMIDKANLMAGSYNLDRKSPKYYTLEFGLVSGSAYKERTELTEVILDKSGEVISGGIIYPMFEPRDDEVSYPDYDYAYVTNTSVQDQKIVIQGNGEVLQSMGSLRVGHD